MGPWDRQSKLKDQKGQKQRILGWGTQTEILRMHPNAAKVTLSWSMTKKTGRRALRGQAFLGKRPETCSQGEDSEVVLG